MNPARDIVHSFSHLFFPHSCAGCGNDIISEGQILCIKCSSQLPLTGFELHDNNPIEKSFWGRVSINNGMSLLHFTKDSILQNLLHQFKYKGKKEIGFYFGKMMGNAILKSGRFKNIDALIALPLFASKEKRRGYNQSTVLCEGMSEILHIPILKNAVIRTTATETQTHKTRIERWQNIEGKFEIKNIPSLQNKHILLVDDVTTTGATLEACIIELLKAENIKLSIATLASTLS
ncbi:MAG TPA: phosphoribosyltransferase family protein [Puia sp.]|nr:phosphoribosyltransferase family protein [Puia sp.]